MIEKLPKISTSSSEPVKRSSSSASVKPALASSSSPSVSSPSKRKTLTSIYEDVVAAKNDLSNGGGDTIPKKEVCVEIFYFIFKKIQNLE